MENGQRAASLRTNDPISADIRGFNHTAGIAYGLVAGLSFILLAWGRDALLLAYYQAEFPWSKILFGFPLAILVCLLAGWLAARVNSMAVSALIWALAGGLLGLLAGRIPYDSGNLSAWLLERRLWGEVIAPYGRAGAIMTAITTLVGVFAGAIIGATEHFALDWAWDRSVEGRRMSLGSWVVMISSVLGVLLLAQVIEIQVNRPLREPIQNTAALLQANLSPNTASQQSGTSGALKPFVGRLSDEYSLQISQYDADILSGSYVDVIFENGMILRCSTVRIDTTSKSMHRVLTCVDFSAQLNKHMTALVHAGLYGHRDWLADEWQKLVVADQVVTWLKDHNPYLSENYRLEVESQRGEWVFASAQFDTGFEMICTLHGLTPLVVETCQSSGSAPALSQGGPSKEASLAESADLPGVETTPLEGLAGQIPWLPGEHNRTPVASYIGFNTAQPPFDDPDVRQAFALATDRLAILLQVNQAALDEAGQRAYFQPPEPVHNAHQVEAKGELWMQSTDSSYVTTILESQLYFQQPRAATTFVHPDALGRDLYGEIGLLFDPQRARQVLASAGYPRGQGFPPVKLAYLESEIHTQISTTLADTWRKELGVDILLEPLEVPAYQERLLAGNVALFLNGWISEYKDPAGFLALFQTPGLEWMRAGDKTLGQLIDQAAAAAGSPAQRQRLYIQAERRLCEQDTFIIPLLHHYLNQ